MALNYDIRKDLRFQQGKEEGKLEGKLEGINEMILSFLKLGKFSIEDIAKAASVSIDYVKKLAEQLGENKK